MKQKIYVLGIITAILIVAASVLKINHLPGAGYLLILGVFMLVFVFMPLALRNHYRTEGSRKNLALYIVTWITCLVVFGGMLWKVQHWPHAGLLLMISLPFPYVVFLPVFLAVTAKDKNFSIYNTVFVLLLLAGISAFSTLLALNVSKERMDDSMSLAQAANRVEKVLDLTKPSQSPNEIAGKIDDLISIVDEYQSLIFTSNGISEREWIENPQILPRPDYPDIASKALITKCDNPKLDTRLQDGLRELMIMLKNDPLYSYLSQAAPLIFDYDNDQDDPSPGWTKREFVSSQRVWSVIYLDALETNLKMIRVSLQ